MTDLVLLSRIQFAITIMFHYLFPPLTIGLGALIVYFEGSYLKTRDEILRKTSDFWIRLFAVNFAMGVSTGIVMEFEFGTNWASYSRFVGDVFGSSLAAEGIFAFFLESGFLAVMVFGRGKVGPKFYFMATILVSIGSVFSSIWITVANSWMQTPAGHHIVPIIRNGEPWVVDGVRMMRAEVVDFWSVVFNPATVPRLLHVWVGCLVLGASFVASISAWSILRNRRLEISKRSLNVAVVAGLIGSVGTLATGHLDGRMVGRRQPAKLAAMEGHFTSHNRPTGIHVFGVPNPSAERVDYAVKIPGLLSTLVYDEIPPRTPVIALDRFPKADRPPVFITFLAFHIMVGLGMFLIGIFTMSVISLWRGKLDRSRKLLWLLVPTVLAAFASNELGWVTAEVGRQPWIVYPRYDGGRFDRPVDGMRTSEAVSKAVRSEQVLASIILFILIYLILFVVWLYVMDGKIRGAGESTTEKPTDPPNDA
jgi:cytochrome d ubiquinol oxidase subunit I